MGARIDIGTSLHSFTTSEANIYIYSSEWPAQGKDSKDVPFLESRIGILRSFAIRRTMGV